MNDEIEILQELRDEIANGELLEARIEDQCALTWAIDQLRWRRVEDELPEHDQTVLAVDDGGWATLHDYTAGSQTFHAVFRWWRPITLPEDGE